MIATCTHCSAQFQLDDSYLKPKGTKVRCARCHEVFTLYPEEKPSEEESGPDFLLDENPESDSEKSILPDASQKEEFDFSLNDHPDDFNMDSFNLDIEEEKTSSGPEDTTNLLSEDFSLDESFETPNFESDADLEEAAPASKNKEAGKNLDSFEVDLDFGDGDQTNWDDFDLDIQEDLPSVSSADQDDYNFIFGDEEGTGQEKIPPKMPGLTAKPSKFGSDDTDQDPDTDFDINNLTMETAPLPENPEPGASPFQAGKNSKSDALHEGVGAGFAKSLGTTTKKAPADSASDPLKAQAPPLPVNQGTAVESIQVKEQPVGRAPLSGQLPVTASKRNPSASRKKALRILLLVLFSVALLYFLAYYAQKNKWVDLPFELAMPVTLEDLPFMNYFFPAEKVDAIPDPGDRHIRTLVGEPKFIDNERLGRLLVLNGKVRNDYSHARKQIRLRAKLFVGTEVIRTRTVYAGNILSDERLSQLPITEIEKELNKPNGDRNNNENVAKGAELPFMFVFADLPANLFQPESGSMMYEINVVSSQQARR